VKRTEDMQKRVDALWTVKQLASHFGVTVMTVHNWRKKGLPTIVLHGDERPALRFVKDDVQLWHEVSQKYSRVESKLV
jgi:hypothetical protein